MDDQTSRQNTARAISENLHRDAEARQKQEEARQTYKSVNQGKTPEKGSDKKTYDTTYKYLLAQELQKAKGKPLDRETDARIAKQMFDVTQAKDANKVRDAIKEHSPLAAQLPQDKRHEYAGAATVKGMSMHLKNVPREERTRVQTPHHETSKLQEMAEMQRHRERER
jgi:hypothetical protein